MRAKRTNIVLILIVILSLSIMLVGCGDSLPVYGNLSRKATIARQGGTESDGISLIDGRADTKWKGDASDEEVYVIMTFGEDVEFNKIILDEAGSHITSFAVSIPAGGGNNWQDIVTGESLEDEDVFTFNAVRANQLKLTIRKSDGKFAIREMGIYYEEFSKAQPTEN